MSLPAVRGLDKPASSASAKATPPFRRDFVFFDGSEPPVIYLDSAASAQKLSVVLDAERRFCAREYSNVHRGRPYHLLSERATRATERVRERIARFINAPGSGGVVFTHGATESINLVASSWGRENIGPGDRIIATVMEHHSNLLPWMRLAHETKATLEYCRVTSAGLLDLQHLDELLRSPAKLVAVTHASNVLGTINPIREIADRSHGVGAITVVDAAQSIPHMPIDVQELGCDFLAFSGHKMGASTGIGVLYGRAELLASMPPFLVGGGTVRRVSLSDVEFRSDPGKFEAGTIAIVQAVGLGAAIEYLETAGMQRVGAHGRELTSLALTGLGAIPGVTILGPEAALRTNLVSFVVDWWDSMQLAEHLDRRGIAIRAGHHCAEPLHQSLGLEGSVRASFYLYNTAREVERLVEEVDGSRPLRV